jgi:hypothetical protein
LHPIARTRILGNCAGNDFWRCAMRDFQTRGAELIAATTPCAIGVSQ